MSGGPTRGRFPALWPAEDVPDVAWKYWALVDTMRHHPAMYGLDERRAELHADLCRVYGLPREQTLSVTANLDRYETAVDMDIALRKLAAERLFIRARIARLRVEKAQAGEMEK